MFYFYAAGLLLMALAFVLRPLLRLGVARSYHDTAPNVQVLKAQKQELDEALARQEISKAEHAEQLQVLTKRLALEMGSDTLMTGLVAQDTGLPARKLAWVLALLLPVFSVGVYWLVGMPQASSAAWVQEQSQLADSARAEQVGQGQQTARERPKPEEMKRMLVEMETQLNAASDFRERVEEWALLARGYRASEDYAGSARVYAKLMEIEPMNTDWLVERADVLAMGAGRNLRGEPSRLLNLALERTPTHPKAMALAGAAAMAENNYNRARELLSRWRAQLSPELQNSEQVQQLFTQLDLAEQKAKSK
ncbi:MAG: hypothetical protein RLZZ502_30 [Pseudomonadota bacterium]